MIVLAAVAFGLPIDTYATTSKTVAKLPKRLAVESPKQKSSLQNKDIVVTGWALDPSGVKEINIYLNDKLQGKANYGLNRPDVNKAYPGYAQGIKSGYTYTINYSTLKTGTYKVSVEMVGKDNKKTRKDTTITFKKTISPLRVALESPALKFSTEANNLMVTGWAAGPTGIKEIKIYLDGIYNGSTTPSINRKDVAGLLPNYKNSLLSGFSYNLSMMNLSKGEHKVSLEYIGNDGQVLKLDRTFEYKGMAPRVALENPKANYSTEAYYISVSGWTLNSAGIEAVNIYVDNVLYGQTEAVIIRDDVAKVYPGYSQGNNCGFSYNLDMRSLSEGSHQLKLEVVAMDKTVIAIQRNFTYNKPKPISSIESPSLNQSVSASTLDVSGWAMNTSGVSSVSVVLDGVTMGNAAYGDTRMDLMSYADRFPEYTSVGYNYTIDISTLSIGKHTIEIIAQGNDGQISNSKTTFSMFGIVEYVYLDYDLDYYVKRQFDRGGNVIFGSSAPPTYEQLKYYMDASNFINDPSGKYMFLKLTYIDGIDVNDLNKVLTGKGVLEGKGQAFLDAGKKHNVNPLYLIAHAILETGNGKSKLSNGVMVSTVASNPVEPKLAYNVYGIGARDSNPVVLGSEYAYNQQWFSVESAIIGGAQFISNNYVQSEIYKQYTLYKMKWNFEVIWHQYATDIGWAFKQTKFIKDLVDQMDKPVLVFEIPVFKQVN